MLGLWLQDLESLEAISALSRDGQMGSFLTELERDEDLDDETKGTLEELAKDDSFLLAVEDYVWRTRQLH
jgi:hypothetical protein